MIDQFRKNRLSQGKESSRNKRDSLTPIDLLGTANGPATVESKALSTAELAEARLKLAHSLQTSLDTSTLIRLFYQQLSQFVPVGGLEFRPHQGGQAEFLGRAGRHQCDYRLSGAKVLLGQLTFSRDRRFSEPEQQLLEELLGSLVFPLRNAQEHQNAIHLALIDNLTGLGNRAALDNALLRDLRLAERQQWDLSLLAIDLDHFKAINDKHGHSRGDQVLRQVADAIQTVCRSSDQTFRYGGEEFVVLLSNTDTEGAQRIAERICETVSQLDFDGDLATTVSIGVSTRKSGHQEHIDTLFDRADRALYKAKTQGRNCVMLESVPKENEQISSTTATLKR